MADVKNWLGKAIGGAIGFLAGGPVGAALGAAIGHRYDLGSMGSFESNFEPHDHDSFRALFFETTFSVMGHIAKIDGMVTKAEIDAAKNIMDRMDLSIDMRQKAVRLYTEGKAADFPIEDTLAKFFAISRHRYTLIRSFIDIQLEAAYADGSLHKEQEAALLKMCDQLNFSRFEFHMLRATRDSNRSNTRERPKKIIVERKQLTLKEAYATLNVAPGTDPDEVRRAYRRLISKHHPDKLVAMGKTPAQVKIANEKTQQIRKAYELISHAQNLKGVR